MVIYVVEYVIKESYSSINLYLLIFYVDISSYQNKNSVFIIISRCLIYDTDKYAFVIAAVMASYLD